MLQFLKEFIGHFHPVIVHLPIGILLLSVFLYWLSTKEKYSAMRPAVKIALLIGLLSALMAVISGLLLSSLDDYDAAMVSRHQWLGIVTTIVSAVAYYAEVKAHQHVKWLMAVMVIL